ncbi:MAG: type II toxin-antitoxin system RelE/ParE family toxin [Thermomicrobiales bacterium]
MSALKLAFSDHAELDIIDILAYAERTWGTDVRDKTANDILKRLMILTLQPELGSPRPEYGRGRRGFVLDSYLVLYTVSRTEIRVARIIHTRLDVDRVLRG